MLPDCAVNAENYSATTFDLQNMKYLITDINNFRNNFITTSKTH
jgi:hypothetical protein